MEWITALKKAIDFMEKNLCNNISADDVAKEVCISSFYLQKGFAIVTGFSLMEYIRNRRLYNAAQDILKNEEKSICHKNFCASKNQNYNTRWFYNGQFRFYNRNNGRIYSNWI